MKICFYSISRIDCSSPWAANHRAGEPPPKGYNDPKISAINAFGFSSAVSVASMLESPDIAIAAAEIEQRVAVSDFNVLNLRNKNRMIAGRLRRMQPAFQISE